MLLDLGKCLDPTSNALIIKLGGFESAGSKVLISLSQSALKEKKWEELSKSLLRLLRFPEAQKEVLSLTELMSQALPYLQSAQAGNRNVESMLGQCQLATGDSAGAQRTLKKLYAKTKELPTLRSILDGALLQKGAHGLAQQNKASEACKLYGRVFNLNPTQLQGQPEVLEDLQKCQDPDTRELLVKVGGLEAASPKVLLALAKSAYQAKKWEDLSKMLFGLTNNEEFRKEILSMTESLSKAKPDLGKPLLKKLAEESASIDAAELLGKILVGEKQCQDELPYLQAAQKGGKNVQSALSDCQVATGDLVGAQKSLKEKYEKTKDLVTLRALLDLTVSRKDADEEYRVLSLLYERNSASTFEKMRLGLMLKNHGQMEKAGPILDQALREKNASKSKDFGEASMAAGLWAWKGLNADRARRHLQNALRVLPDSVSALIALAQASQVLGAWGDVENAYTALLRKVPNHVEANRFLADKRISQKRFSESIPFLRLLVDLDPKDGKSWAKYGNSLIETSNFSEASTALQTALDLGIEDEDVFINRARAYHAEGTKDMAISIMNFLVTRNPKSEKARQW